MIDATMSKRMEEATRLTRAGKLHEAMALLQGSVPEAGREETPDNAYRGGNTFDGTWQVNDKEDTVTEPEPATSPTGAFTPNDTKVPAAWRDKWMKFRGGMAQPDQPSDSEEANPGAFTAGRFTHHVGTRDYKLYIPRAIPVRRCRWWLCCMAARRTPMTSLPEPR